MEQVEAEREHLQQRERRAQDEAARAPSDNELRDHLAKLDMIRMNIDQLRRRVATAEERVATQRTALNDATEQRDRAAQDLNLSQWVANLSGFSDRLSEYQQCLARLWPTLIHHVSARQLLISSQSRERAAQEELEQRRAHHLQANQKAQEAIAARDTLEETVGVAVEDILRRLTEARRQLETIRADQKACQQQRTDRTTQLEIAKRDILQHREALQNATVEREGAITRLHNLVAARLLATAQDEFADVEADAWTVSRSVEIARRIEHTFATVDSDDGAWQRNQRNIHGHIQTLTETLSRTAMRANQEDSLSSQPNSRRSCRWLTFALLDDESRLGLLDAQREVLENHLIAKRHPFSIASMRPRLVHK